MAVQNCFFGESVGYLLSSNSYKQEFLSYESHTFVVFRNFSTTVLYQNHSVCFGD